MHLVKGQQYNVKINAPFWAEDLEHFISGSVTTTVEVNRHGKLVCLAGNPDVPHVDSRMFEGRVFDPDTGKQLSNLPKKSVQAMHGWVHPTLKIEE